MCKLRLPRNVLTLPCTRQDGAVVRPGDVVDKPAEVAAPAAAPLEPVDVGVDVGPAHLAAHDACGAVGDDGDGGVGVAFAHTLCGDGEGAQGHPKG